MGSTIEINDTLQLTREQGFPVELNFAQHVQTPYRAEDFAGKLFSFTNKSGIRVYQIPPVRNLLVENRNGKWIYWGIVHVMTLTHDYERKITSGTFKIVHLYTPDEMKKMHDLVDGNPEKRFF